MAHIAKFLLGDQMGDKLHVDGATEHRLLIWVGMYRERRTCLYMFFIAL